MGDDLDTGAGGCLMKFVIAICIVCFFGMAASLFADDGGSNGGLFNDNRRTSTNTVQVDMFSNNSVEIFSPDTYVNTGDTETRVSGDRNQVAPAAGCWLSSQQAWGTCPEWAPEGSAVP